MPTLAKIFERNFNRKIKEEAVQEFSVPVSGIYIIQVQARCNAWWNKFPRFLRKFFSDDELTAVSGTQEVKWNGNDLVGLRQTGIFVNRLAKGSHKILLTPKRSPFVEAISVFRVESERADLSEIIDLTPEDGNRRPYLLIRIDESVLLQNFTITVTPLEGRKHLVFLRDDDDLQVRINNEIVKNDLPKSHKFWYWCGRVQKGKSRKLKYTTGEGVFSLDFFADRTPKIEEFSVKFVAGKVSPKDGKEEIRQRIREKAKELGIDPDLMVKLAECESSLNPRAVSEDNARGLFQLTPIAIKQVENLGFKITDPLDIGQNIHGGILYFKWTWDQYSATSDFLRKTLLAWIAGPSSVPKDEPFDISGFSGRDQRDIKVLIRCVLGKDAI